MKLISKIKTTFSNDLLKLIASICDTKRIDSNQRKMKLLCELLKTHNIKFDILGGATNRIVLFIDSYSFKFAIDSQGFIDNYMEYALSNELQPYVTKSYETNGYILVAECVRPMTLEEFRLRKIEMSKILDIIGSEYLLGDVGLIEKNFTNWGIRDDNNAVILDYAYIHRGTEKLFTCEVCGTGLLVYDQSYTQLRCNNRTVCKAHYSYTERRRILGDEGDIQMVNEAKDNSVMLKPNDVSIDVVVSDTGGLRDNRVFVINNYHDLIEYERMRDEMLLKKYKDEREMSNYMDNVMDSDIERTIIFQEADGTTAHVNYDIPKCVISPECEDDIFLDDNGVPHMHPIEDDEDEEECGISEIINMLHKQNESLSQNIGDIYDDILSDKSQSTMYRRGDD